MLNYNGCHHWYSLTSNKSVIKICHPFGNRKYNIYNNYLKTKVNIYFYSRHRMTMTKQCLLLKIISFVYQYFFQKKKALRKLTVCRQPINLFQCFVVKWKFKVEKVHFSAKINSIRIAFLFENGFSLWYWSSMWIFFQLSMEWTITKTLTNTNTKRSWHLLHFFS